MELFDSHAHYNDEKFDIDRETILRSVYKKMEKTNVSR